MEIKAIKARIDELSIAVKAIEEEVSILRSKCPHPVYARGYNMMGCITSVDICCTCGASKPIFDYASNEGYGMSGLVHWN